VKPCISFMSTSRATSERQGRRVSETGVLGDPAQASSEVGGEALIAAVADELADFFAEHLDLERIPRSGD
jgi:creatinine amidohydrolase/Fe(II)-dependent formamide hydrolase-like protein